MIVASSPSLSHLLRLSVVLAMGWMVVCHGRDAWCDEPVQAEVAEQANDVAAEEEVQEDVVFAEVVEFAVDGALQGGVAANFMRPVAVVEVSFAKRVCDLSEGQEQTIITAAKQTLEHFAKHRGKNVVGAQQIVFFGGRQRNSDPRSELETALRAAITKQLDEAQAKIYRQELDERVNFKRDAIIDSLLVQLDDKLALSEQQCTQVRDGMREHWSEDWAPSIDMLENYGQHYFPQIPDKAVTKALTKEQLEVWRGLQKVHFSNGGMNNFQTDGVIDDVDWGE